MYRRYEDPYKLQKMLEEAQAEYDAENWTEDRIDAQIDAYNWIEELKERINFAWQDDEAECEGYDY